MKRKFWKGILIALCAAAFCAALAACGGGGKKYDHLVTFDYNYYFESEGYEKKQYFGVAEEYPYAYAPGSLEKFALAEFNTSYELEGWYLPKLDAEGNPLSSKVTIPWTRSASGQDIEIDIIEPDLEKPWDFSSPVTEDITLYAHYRLKPALVVVEEKGGKEYQRRTGNAGERLSRPTVSNNDPKKQGYTFLEYYTDEAKTQVLEWPVTLGDGDTTVYGKFIEGDKWMIVDTPEKFNQALSSSKDIYIPEGTEEIDFTGKPFYSGYPLNKLEGHGCLIKGISIDLDSGTASSCSLFGNIGASALVQDVTFEATLTFLIARTGTYKVSMFAISAEAGATLKNVTVRGSVTITKRGASTLPTLFTDSFICENEGTCQDCDWSGVVLDDKATNA